MCPLFPIHATHSLPHVPSSVALTHSTHTTIHVRFLRAAAVDPAELFADVRDQYSAFDDAGIPTKLADGTDLPKKTYKGLQKRANGFQKDREKLLKSANGDVAAYIAAIEADVADLKMQLQ